MVKSSFTLFETLISTILLLIVVVGFSKTSYYENFDKEFMLLNNLENSFNTNSYNSNFSKEEKNIKIIINETNKENRLVNKITYKDEQIELFKYENK